MAAITAILARYPQEVITAVTHPASGLPSKKGWLPTVKEVTDACNEAVEPIIQNEARIKRIQEQFAAREREAKGEKPTLEQLHDRFGVNWGLEPERRVKPQAKPAPSWDEIKKHYAKNPMQVFSTEEEIAS